MDVTDLQNIINQGLKDNATRDITPAGLRNVLMALLTALDTDKADVSAVPTKNSQLENDSGYLTQHQDLSNYVDKTGNQEISGKKYFTSGLTARAKFSSPNANPGVLDATQFLSTRTQDSIEYGNVQLLFTNFSTTYSALIYSYNELDHLLTIGDSNNGLALQFQSTNPIEPITVLARGADGTLTELTIDDLKTLIGAGSQPAAPGDFNEDFNEDFDGGFGSLPSRDFNNDYNNDFK